MPAARRGYRQEWLKYGARWVYPGERPENGVLEERLRGVPAAFR
jgi:hypothetical protein